MKKSITISAFVLMASTSNLAYAQVAPTIGDAIRQAKPPEEVQKHQSKSLVEIEGIKKEYRPKLTEDKILKKVLVTNFSIEGNQHIDSGILLSQIESYKDKTLSFNDMQAVAANITRYYREQGYIVARAYIPVQEMDNGVLDIVIIEGTYGEFKLLNHSKVNTVLIQSILGTGKKGTVINSKTLERSLLITNDLPGVVISSADIKPGKEIGTSDFIITTEEGKGYDGYILGDNYGGRYTGTNRLMIGVNAYAPLGVGDKLSLFGLVTKNGDLTNGLATYSVPLYRNGLRAEIGFSNTTYQLGEEFSSLDSSGNAKSYHAKLSYPVLKQRTESLDMFLKVEKSFFTDEVGSVGLKTDKNILSFRLGTDYQKTDINTFGLNQQLKANIVFTHGDLEFKDASQIALDKAGVDTGGVFNKITFGIAHTTELNRQLSLDMAFKYQHALGDKNLDGSEDFSIGGSDGVKLFPTGELSAENGYVFKIEAKYKLPQRVGFSHSLGVFYDQGQVEMENPTSTFQKRILQDIGVGYYANYKGLFAKAQGAWQVGEESVTSEPERNFRLLAMMGWYF